MFWDKVSGVYDLFENIYNKSVYQSTGESVAKHINNTDRVLECACGTGAISIYIAPVCHKLFASDYSAGMLNQARKKLSAFDNVELKKVDITNIKAKDNSFDVVVAGNVIHLLPEPQSAMKELTRVCRDGGRLIIPTYINGDEGTNKLAVKFLEKLGASFKRQFDSESYEKFFEEMGYENVTYEIIRGRMSCDIAIIDVKKEACMTAQEAYSLAYIKKYDGAQSEHHPGARTAKYYPSLGKWRLRIQLDDKRVWFLSVFVKEDGVFEKYSLDQETAEDSHYEFCDESGFRKDIYYPGDEHMYLAEVLIRYVERNGGNNLLAALRPFITAEFHF